MRSEPDVAKLVERYKSLGAADRRAVLSHLSADERNALEQACVAPGKDPGRSLAAGRQFAGYSGWLAARIELALSGNDEAQKLTSACRTAMVASHKAAIAGAQEESPWFKVLRQVGLVANPKADEDSPAC